MTGPALAAGQLSMARTVFHEFSTVATVRCVACRSYFVGEVEHVARQFRDHDCQAVKPS